MKATSNGSTASVDLLDHPPLDRQKLGGQVLDRLLKMVEMETIKPGDQLPSERALMSAFRVGRPAVREALIYAMRKDPNAGDRLDALKTIQTMDWGNDVHQALLAAAERDKNPGVSFAAMDTLVNRAVREKDTALLPALRSLATRNSNTYVRVKCAEAIHELAADRR